MFGRFLLHVRYVTNETAGGDVTTGELFGDALGDVMGVTLTLVVLIALAGFAWLAPRLVSWGSFRASLNAALTDYEDFVPWILRLSTGISLMGAGMGGYLFVPHVAGTPRGFIALLFLACGFTILVGIALRLAALVALVLWGYTLGIYGLDAFMVTEVMVALVALTAISAGRPSLDDLWARTLESAPWGLKRVGAMKHLFGPAPDDDVSEAFLGWIPVALRAGLGLSLLYAGIAEKLLDPGRALATVAQYDLAVGPLTPARWVVTVGLVEIVLGLGLIVGIAVRPLAAVSFLVLTATLFMLPDDPVVAHVSLWGVASAVFILGCGPASVDRWRMRRMAAAA